MIATLAAVHRAAPTEREHKPPKHRHADAPIAAAVSSNTPKAVVSIDQFRAHVAQGSAHSMKSPIHAVIAVKVSTSSSSSSSAHLATPVSTTLPALPTERPARDLKFHRNSAEASNGASADAAASKVCMVCLFTLSTLSYYTTHHVLATYYSI